MGRTPSGAARTSLYKLAGVAELRHAIRTKYLQAPALSAQDVEVGGRAALLLAGAMVTELVSWATTVQRLTSTVMELGNTTAAAVVIIRGDDEAAWALTYGMGFQLLDQERIDNGFGQRVAIRVAAPENLKSLTRTVLDQRARTDRSTIPAGERLRNFGVGDVGELVTRLITGASVPALTAGAEPFTVRGADCLSIPLGRAAETLLADLDVIDDLLDRPADEELRVLEQLVAIKHDAALTARLDAELEEALSNPAGAKLGLAWPHEKISDNGEPAAFRITSAGRGRVALQDGIPQLVDLLDAVSHEPPGARLSRMRRIRIQLYRDSGGDESISTAIPGLRWIAFEVDDGDKRYCLHDGAWYHLGHDYAQGLREQTRKIFARGPGVPLPAWRAGMDEKTYNEHAARELGGSVLDRRLIHTGLHRHGIEVCDVLTAEGALVHVKRVDSSAPASHLLAQALVSADALLHDEEARAAFREMVPAGATSPDGTVRRPVVVLGVARQGRPITCDDLFTFTQVTLVRQVQALQGRGVDVFISPIAWEG